MRKAIVGVISAIIVGAIIYVAWDNIFVESDRDQVLSELDPAARDSINQFIPDPTERPSQEEVEEQYNNYLESLESPVSQLSDDNPTRRLIEDCQDDAQSFRQNLAEGEELDDSPTNMARDMATRLVECREQAKERARQLQEESDRLYRQEAGLVSQLNETQDAQEEQRLRLDLKNVEDEQAQVEEESASLERFLRFLPGVVRFIGYLFEEAGLHDIADIFYGIADFIDAVLSIFDIFGDGDNGGGNGDLSSGTEGPSEPGEGSNGGRRSLSGQAPTPEAEASQNQRQEEGWEIVDVPSDEPGFGSYFLAYNNQEIGLWNGNDLVLRINRDEIRGLEDTGPPESLVELAEVDGASGSAYAIVFRAADGETYLLRQDTEGNWSVEESNDVTAQIIRQNNGRKFDVVSGCVISRISRSYHTACSRHRLDLPRRNAA